MFGFLRSSPANSKDGGFHSCTRQYELPLQKLMGCFANLEVDELLISGWNRCFLRKGYSLVGVESPFQDDLELLDFLLDFAASQEIRLDASCGSAGGVLADLPGRWHCVLPPISGDGPIFCMRRHRFDRIFINDFLITPCDLAHLQEHLEKRLPLLISGATGSGKTTFLVALLSYYAATERALIVESIPEIPALNPLWIRLLGRRESLDQSIPEISLYHLLSEALRLSPDRIVIGEMRGSEVRAFHEVAKMGHGGLMATIHAGSAIQARDRLLELSPEADFVGKLGVIQLERGRPPRVSEFSVF